VALWLPGLLVAAGAIAAIAHGLYEVATAAQVPPAIAWRHPVITDGLALVAYAEVVPELVELEVAVPHLKPASR
jgi:hypothetical protein